MGRRDGRARAHLSAPPKRPPPPSPLHRRQSPRPLAQPNSAPRGTAGTRVIFASLALPHPAALASASDQPLGEAVSTASQSTAKARPRPRQGPQGGQRPSAVGLRPALRALRAPSSRPGGPWPRLWVGRQAGGASAARGCKQAARRHAAMPSAHTCRHCCRYCCCRGSGPLCSGRRCQHWRRRCHHWRRRYVLGLESVRARLPFAEIASASSASACSLHSCKKRMKNLHAVADVKACSST